MANRIKVANAQAILGLWPQGRSYRGIARMVGVHRGTVTRYVKQETDGAKPAAPTLGSETPEPAIATLGSECTGSSNGKHPGLPVMPSLA
jgi:transposase